MKKKIYPDRNNNNSNNRNYDRKPNKTKPELGENNFKAPHYLENEHNIFLDNNKGQEQIALLIRQEQLHRHKLEKLMIECYAKSRRFGQICGLLLVISIIYATIYLAEENYKQTALFVCISGFSFMAICASIAAKNRSAFNYDKNLNRSYVRNRRPNYRNT